MIIIKCLAIISIIFALVISFKGHTFLTFKRALYSLNHIEKAYQQENLASQIIWSMANATEDKKLFQLPANIIWQDCNYELRLNDYNSLLNLWNIGSQESVNNRILIQRDPTLNKLSNNYYQELLTYTRSRTISTYLSKTAIQFDGEIHWLVTSSIFMKKIREQISAIDLPLAPVISTLEQPVKASFFYTDSHLITSLFSLTEQEQFKIIQLQQQAFKTQKVPLQFEEEGRVTNLLKYAYHISLQIPNDLHLVIKPLDYYKTLELTFPTKLFINSKQKVFHIWQQQ